MFQKEQSASKLEFGNNILILNHLILPSIKKKLAAQVRVLIQNKLLECIIGFYMHRLMLRL